MDKVLIIEGTSDDTNGDLKGAIGRLLEQKLKRKMPRIIMGDGKNQSVDKFLHQPKDREKTLLIDLDADDTERERILEEYDLISYDKTVFFMIQEMEAWFLSQPTVLEQYYGIEFTSKIRRPAHTIADPCSELQRLTKNTKKKTYHKVKHAVELLPKLDLVALCNSFDDVKNLIDRLSL
ncbi:DUF4276 family protein [Fibrella sp. HMF5335]|uniref:DUF4276 family protein n=1 Tax=Fibrella rubiginis TaxID=2817060 RepID=A0A939K548_9BACT|nr:DUF4276 family protein [Fibrella rubiginis]MBO0936881.1 DUF4276 family protein [Fibrella rubiginis]